MKVTSATLLEEVAMLESSIVLKRAHIAQDRVIIRRLRREAKALAKQGK